jgi:hypothetical protein
MCGIWVSAVSCDENIDAIQENANPLSHRDSAYREGAGDAGMATIGTKAVNR